jgi:hypothetical protein
MYEPPLKTSWADTCAVHVLGSSLLNYLHYIHYTENKPIYTIYKLPLAFRNTFERDRFQNTAPHKALCRISHTRTMSLSSSRSSNVRKCDISDVLVCWLKFRELMSRFATMNDAKK